MRCEILHYYFWPLYRRKHNIIFKCVVLKHEIEGLWLFGSVSRLVSSAEDWLLGRDCRLVRIKA